MHSPNPRWLAPGMIFLATAVAFLLYLDRICLSTASQAVEEDMQLPSGALKWILSAFFWTYALAQLPAGWLGDRYGARLVLGSYVILWSSVTGLLAFANGVVSLLVLRLLCGLFEAGAYPVAAGIVRDWVPFHFRGLASSIVSIGGRFGGALAPIITIQLMMLVSAYGTLRGTDEIAPWSWRPVMLLYGALGIGVGLLFIALYRDRPGSVSQLSASRSDHLNLNDDLEPVAPSCASSTAGKVGAPVLPFSAMIRSSSLWMMSGVRFASNLGWAFLVTMMPAYLNAVHQVTLEGQGWIQTITLSCGILGLLAGGIATDVATKFLGLRFGRAALLSISRLIVAVAFLASLGINNALHATVALAIVGFATDLGIGAMWTYAQDVGGKYAGSVLGWSNMWGNLGAALSPLVFGAIAESFPDSPQMGWHVAFLVCGVIQTIAAFLALGVSAIKPLQSCTKHP